MIEIKISTLEETKKFSKKLANKLKAGDIIGIIGDLGAGKTTISKEIAKEIGVSEIVTSPTYTIVNEYHSGRVPFYHFDVYRINDSDDLFEIGYEDYFFGKGITVVEWADLVEDLLPSDAIIIKITKGFKEEERIYHITGLEDI